VQQTLTDTTVLGGSFEEGILLDLARFLYAEGGRNGLLAGSGFGFGRLVMETSQQRD